MNALPTTQQVQIRSITLEGEDVLSYELRALGGGPLPPFSAGAHIDLHLRDGLVRSYSLLNTQDDGTRYVIAIKLDANGRGGSREAHQTLRVGQSLTIGQPRNLFPLDEAAPHSVLIAGGIGITPLWSMAQRLESLGQPWQLHYSARTRQQAALLERIEQLDSATRQRVRLNFDQEPEGRMLDLADLVASQPAGTHFYCCGPLGMLEAFEKATAHLPREQVHREYFSSPQEKATAGGFTVKLARSGLSLPVPAGQTILQAFLDAGVDVPYSCMDGICGSCEVRVLEGEPEHRDLVLGPEEQASNTRMMVCCSGSRSATLVLDL